MEKRIVIRPKKERDCTFSIRIDKEIQTAYEELSTITGYSRNELINIAMKHLFQDLDIVTKEEKTKKLIEEFYKKYMELMRFEYKKFF